MGEEQMASSWGRWLGLSTIALAFALAKPAKAEAPKPAGQKPAAGKPSAPAKAPGPAQKKAGPPPSGPNDEWCKRLKEVFPRYMAAFDKYAESSREVGAYVEAFTDDRDVREVDAMQKKFGKHYHYQFSSLTLEGKLMMRAVRAELAKNAPDAAVLQQHFDAYFAIADETKAMMDKEPNKSSEPYPPSLQFIMIESLPKLKRVTAGMLTTLANTTDKKRAEHLDHDWSDLVGAYNEIVRYGN